MSAVPSRPAHHVLNSSVWFTTLFSKGGSLGQEHSDLLQVILGQWAACIQGSRGLAWVQFLEQLGHVIA